jgi:hypothetical protein
MTDDLGELWARWEYLHKKHQYTLLKAQSDAGQKEMEELRAKFTAKMITEMCVELERKIQDVETNGYKPPKPPETIQPPKPIIITKPAQTEEATEPVEGLYS